MATRGRSRSVGRGPGNPRSIGRGIGRGRGGPAEREVVGRRRGEILGPTMPGGGKPHQKSPEECIIIDDLVIYKRQRIGGGAFGTVFKGRFGEQPCAVKVLKDLATQLTSQFSTADDIQDEDLARFKKECKLLESYTHPNIVRHMETLIDPDSNLPLLVMELMDENLTRFLGQPDSESTLLPLQLQISLCCNVACGLQYLHSNNIVHHDLCSDNVLLKHDGSKLIAAVSDFGISRIIDPDNVTRTVGTVSQRHAYMPPRNQMTASSIYDTSLDVFSFGVVAVQIVRKVPKVATPKDRDSHVQKIKSHPLRDVILCCLQEDKEKRPKTSEICHYLSELLSTRGEKTKDAQLLGHGKAVATLQFESPAGGMAQDAVTLSVTSLPYAVTVEDLKEYFENQGQSVQTHPTILGGGNARVEVSGFTPAEIEELQRKPHQLKGQRISVDFAAQPRVVIFPPFRQSLPGSSTRDGDTALSNVLEVKNIPSNVDEEHLTLYFRSPSSGSAQDAMQECKMIGCGIAHVSFHRPEVARRVLFKEGGHIIEGAQLEVKYAQFASNKLVVHELPDGVDKEYLELLLRSKARLPRDGFSVEMEEQSAIITFPTDRSNEDLDEIIVKMRSEPKCLVVQRCKVSTSVRLQNITEHYSKDFIKLYFESPDSGGGEVASVELPGSGEAVIAFSDHRVVDTVLKKTHGVLGKEVHLTIEDPVKTLQRPPLSHPLQITVNPLIAKALQKSSRGLQDKLKLWKAHLSSIDEAQGTIVITPTVNTKPGWEEECKDYIQSEYIIVEEQIPKQALAPSFSVISTNAQLETIPFAYELSDDGALKAAGDTSTITRLRTTIQEHTHIEKEVPLSPKDYEFVSQVKVRQVEDAHPSVTISLIPQKHLVLLNGPTHSVSKLQQSLQSYAHHTSITVQVNAQIASYLFTECGRQKLQSFIALWHCQVAVYFNQQQSQLTVQLLCDPEHNGRCQAVAQAIEKQTQVETLSIPELLAPVLSELEDYKQFSLELQREQGVQIDTSDQQVTLVGFQKDVVMSKQSLDRFLIQRCKSIQPLEVTVGTLVGKALSINQDGLDNALQAHLHVKLTINRAQGMIVISPTKYMKFNWQEECEQQVLSYVKSIKSEIPIPKQGVDDINPFLISKYQEDIPFAFEFRSDQDPALLTVVADASTLEVINAKANEIRSDYDVTDWQGTLPPEEYVFISQVKQHQICADYPKLNVTFQQPTNSIQLHGSAGSIKQLKQQLTSHTHHERVQVKMSDPLIVQHLNTDTGLQQLKQLFQEKQWPTVAFYFERVSPSQHTYALWLLCNPGDIDSVQATVELLQKEFLVVPHPIPGTFTSLDPQSHYSEEYRQLCQNLESKYQVLMEDQLFNRIVKVAGLESRVNFSVKELDNFFKRVCTVTQHTQVDRGIWRLFQSYMQPQWSNVVSEYETKGVEFMHLDEAAKVVTIKLTGEGAEVDRMMEAIRGLVDSVAMECMSFNRPGTCKFFREETTQDLMAGLETKKKVCIEITEVNKSEPMEIEDSPAVSILTTVCVAHIPAVTKELKQVKVCIGDITNFKGDVIVNAANESLQHAGGVARAISQKGGPIIQQDSDNYISTYEKVDVGNAILFSNTGDLPCKALIHAVGPQWEGGQKHEDYLLGKACTQSLEKAHRYQSIAIPAISTGVFGFPIDLAAAALVNSAVKFLTTKATNIKEINFVLIDHDKAEEFVKALSENGQVPAQHFARLTAQPQQSTPVPVASATTPSGQYSKKKKSWLKKLSPASPPVSTKLNLHQGSLLDVKADVYVNTTNGSLDLSQGGLAPVLLKAAGQSLQDECKKKSPVQVGDIAVTSGGNIKCKYVFHVVGEKFDGPGGKGEMVLRTLVKKCMKQCVKRKVTSIAFPAIGTGNLNFPAAVVAKVMLDEVSRKLAKKSASAISYVHFVIQVQDTLIFQAFQHEMTHFTQPHTWPAPVSPLLSISSKSKPQGGASASGTLPTSKPVFDIGGLKVELVHGDITDDDSDVVVNTTNTNLQLGGSGVAGALLRKGGTELQELCNKAVSQGSKLKEGQVIDTKATGSLKFDSVFHVAFTSQDTKEFFKIIHACLQKAEDLQYTSIAFPAIGTGVHGYPAPAAAKGMKEAIEKFAGRNPSYIAQIRIILFKQQVYQTFVNEFSTLQTFEESDLDTSEEDEPQSSSGSHLLQRIFGGVKQSATAIGQYFLGDDEPPDESDVTANEYQVQSSETTNKELELKIYGEKATSVKDTVQKIQKLLKQTFITEKMELFAQLPQSVIARLRKECKAREVDIEFDFPMRSITLKGDRADVGDMKNSIYRELTMVKEQEIKKRAVEDLQKMVQWKRQDSLETYTDYDPDENYAIEQAYRNDEEEYEHHTSSTHFTIDFELGDLKERDHKTNKTCKVVRVDLLTGQRPHNWEPMPRDSTTDQEVRVHHVDLTSDSQEYNLVLKHFHKTVEKGKDYSTISSIQRIQSPVLYSQYMTKKEDMERQNPGQQNERLLFHGTTANRDVLDSISLQSFNRSFAGQAVGTMYGHGSYFARDASYSVGYARPDSQGNCHMFLVRVLTGEFTQGATKMLAPPPKDTQKSHILYDSVVDNPTNPSIFVTFQDCQAYPEYLIIFKK